MRALTMRFVTSFSLLLIFFMYGSVAQAECIFPNPRLVTCQECEEPEEMVAAFERAFPNGENIEADAGQLYLAIRFRTGPMWSMASIPINKICGESWEETVANNWTEIQQKLAELLLATGPGGGGLGPGGPGGGGGGGFGGGGFGGGGGGDDDGWCIYSDGEPDPGNHPACPPTLGG